MYLRAAIDLAPKAFAACVEDRFDTHYPCLKGMDAVAAFAQGGSESISPCTSVGSKDNEIAFTVKGRSESDVTEILITSIWITATLIRTTYLDFLS